MKFKEKYRVIYCKDYSYNKTCNNNDYFYVEALYYKGCLVHREDGPAIEYISGAIEWYLNGIKYNEKEYWKFINLKNKSRVLDEV